MKEWKRSLTSKTMEGLRRDSLLFFQKGELMTEETKITTKEVKKMIDLIDKIIKKDGYITRAEFEYIVEDTKWNIWWEL